MLLQSCFNTNDINDDFLFAVWFYADNARQSEMSIYHIFYPSWVGQAYEKDHDTETEFWYYSPIAPVSELDVVAQIKLAVSLLLYFFYKRIENSISLWLGFMKLQYLIA